MIIQSGVYRAGQRLELECGPHDYAAMRAAATEPGDFVWLGLYAPDDAELHDVAAAFDLHPLAVEDAAVAHQRPKLETYGSTLFLVLRTLWYVDSDDAVETGEISIFLGPGFVITVRHGEGASLTGVRRTLEHRTTVLGHGPSAVLYAVCDDVVDGYTAVVADLQIDVDEIEASVFSENRSRDAERIYVLKRELSEARRAIVPLRDPVRHFAEGTVEQIDEATVPYFRDVSDHLHQAAEALEGLDGLLSSAFDAHLSRVGVQQNDDMRKISAGGALIVVPTLIAGIYGMNFEHMPLLGWTYGYPFSLLLMVGSVVGLLVLFKRSGWL
ncbi:magnesium/cobalt transporter CorA [Nocardioides sp. zg-536]|uniref:Magnesium transport protein CorA n=1 Tax=Nocardioides faecalis TaxID=2803858 RepID=A0A938XYW8_9ACTN|nr:magnesium/cobalt transporter CorA [Nocardioides faecalis]MBM9459032.1 magnesium/cobalt transporter CorA [Nocardioides faecalis]MBS4753866.1 magnesium/cobalt transporter CorA [Nocardioides faecalis]QVI57298.1 magnesium/cobalt transporter CorA [Nocardioides faecalis]